VGNNDGNSCSNGSSGGSVGGNSCGARLPIPAGILRIPVFSAPVVPFSQESRFLFCRNFFERHPETCLYGAYVESYVGYQFVRQKQNTIQFYGTLRWLLSTTVAEPPPPLLRRHHCASTTTATPIAALPLPLPSLHRLSHCCTAIAVTAPPLPLLHRLSCCCTA
jgi:hypothetical protein